MLNFRFPALTIFSVTKSDEFAIHAFVMLFTFFGLVVRVGLITSRKKSLHHGVIHDNGPSWIAIAALVVVTLHGRFNFNVCKLINCITMASSWILYLYRPS